MSIASQKYIRKPLYVDAVRIEPQNFTEIAAWCQGEILSDGGKQYIKVRVHNPKNPRQTKAFVGDWLLYTERGYKVYTNKAFHASFDAVQEEGTTTPPTPIETVAGPEEVVESMYDVAADVNQQMREGLIDRIGTEPEEVEMVQEIEVVPATSQTIAAEVQRQEALRAERSADLAKGQVAKPVHTVTQKGPEPTVDDVPEQESIEPAAAEGKRVLSIAEQKELSSTEVRDLIQSGEVVLAQDLARS